MEFALSSENTKKFINGGNATLTIRSKVTGTRFTYKVRCDRKKKNDANKLLFVSVLTGNDNLSNYTYIGMIRNKTFQLTKKSKFGMDAPSVKVFDWFSKKVETDSIPPSCEVFHQGRCGRCGKKLTVPESIESGFGPFCLERTTV
jgi:hypothetical protein